MSGSRRDVLRGLGACVALPWLESRAHAHLGLPLRLLVMYAPWGAPMESWRPARLGAGWTPSPILTPLAGWEEQVTVVSGLTHRPGEVAGPMSIAAATGSLLSATAPVVLPGGGVAAGTSMDQLLAAAEAVHTAVPSLSLSSEGTGVCVRPWCAGAEHISWSASDTPVSRITHPRVAFEALFIGSDPRETAVQRMRRTADRRSVLDQVGDDIARLTPLLGWRDRLRLEDYLDGIRDVERRLDLIPTPGCGILGVEEGPLTPEAQVTAMVEILELALRCDQTRIASWMLGHGGSERTFEHLGIASSHRALAMEAADPVARAQLVDIVRWEVSLYGDLLDRLAGHEESAGSSVLDNSIVVFLSERGEPDQALLEDLPVLVGGGGGGFLDPGRHVDVSGRPLADLHAALMEVILGTPVVGFGDDGTSALTEL